MLPFKAGADCAAPPLYIISNNREGKTMITRRDFLKVTGAAAAAAALTACGGSGDAAKSEGDGAASGDALLYEVLSPHEVRRHSSRRGKVTFV